MNTAQTVFDVLTKLSELNCRASVCGGWAEEAFGLTKPRAHKDIDLVLQADSFAPLDQHLAHGRLGKEIVAKRFHHKRAFDHAGTMVELYLVESEADEWVTRFWGDKVHRWHAPLMENVPLGEVIIQAVTPVNLIAFRASHKLHQPWRWRDPKSLVSPSL